MITRHVFDLDDTLIRYGRRGAVVPRQTFHALRALHYAGHELAVVSYNPWARVLVASTGLDKYIAHTVTESPGDTERADLVARVCCKAGWAPGAKFYYYDDRSDNIENIHDRFGSQADHQLVTSSTLWKHIAHKMAASPNSSKNTGGF